MRAVDHQILERDVGIEHRDDHVLGNGLAALAARQGDWCHHRGRADERIAVALQRDRLADDHLLDVQAGDPQHVAVVGGVHRGLEALAFANLRLAGERGT